MQSEFFLAQSKRAAYVYTRNKRARAYYVNTYSLRKSYGGGLLHIVRLLNLNIFMIKQNLNKL
jgi:hypothetical protein